MLFWMSLSVFGFSIGLIWHNSTKKKNERELKLRMIQRKIEANERAKTKQFKERSLSKLD